MATWLVPCRICPGCRTLGGKCHKQLHLADYAPQACQSATSERRAVQAVGAIKRLLSVFSFTVVVNDLISLNKITRGSAPRLSQPATRCTHGFYRSLLSISISKITGVCESFAHRHQNGNCRPVRFVVVTTPFCLVGAVVCSSRISKQDRTRSHLRC